MTKKVRHEKEPATDQPEAIGDHEPAGGAEPEASALVEGGRAAPDRGTEDPGGAADAAAGAAEAAGLDAIVPFGSSDGTAQTAAQNEGAAGDDTGVRRDVTDPVANGIDADAEHDAASDAGPTAGQLASWSEIVRDDVKFVEALPEKGMSIGDQVMIFSEGVYTAFEWLGEPPHWERLEQLGERHPPPQLGTFEAYANAHPGFYVASEAAWNAFHHALHIQHPDSAAAQGGIYEWLNAHPEIEPLDGDCYVEAAKLLREIGHARATVDVVATQLKIAGLRKNGHATGAVRVELEVLLFILAALDGFEKAEAERLAREKAEAERVAPLPVPVEDTTMDLGDDPLDTVRV